MTSGFFVLVGRSDRNPLTSRAQIQAGFSATDIFFQKFTSLHNRQSEYITFFYSSCFSLIRVWYHLLLYTPIPYLQFPAITHPLALSNKKVTSLLLFISELHQLLLTSCLCHLHRPHTVIANPTPLFTTLSFLRLPRLRFPRIGCRTLKPSKAIRKGRRCSTHRQLSLAPLRRRSRFDMAHHPPRRAASSDWCSTQSSTVPASTAIRKQPRRRWTS